MCECRCAAAPSARRLHSGIVAVGARRLVADLPLADPATLRDSLDRTGRLIERVVLVEPFVLEHRLRIGMTIDLAGVSLAPAARAHALPLPAAARTRRALVEILFVETCRVLLVGADEQPADDGDDARHLARHGHRVLGLLSRLHPSR